MVSDLQKTEWILVPGVERSMHSVSALTNFAFCFFMFLDRISCLDMPSQCAEKISNHIVNPFTKTYKGWKSMIQRFQAYFAWNPKMKGI